MKKTSFMASALALLLASAAFTGCDKTNTDDIWDSIHDINNRIDALERAVAATNSDVEALKSLVEALQAHASITSVEQTTDGYILHLSDGKEIRITNGVNGADAPGIAVIKGDDGLYYWTIGGEIVMVDGAPVCATGTAPKIRINPDTKMWEISTDNGKTWESTGVVASAAGSSTSAVFASVDTSNPDNVTFTLTNGETFSVPRTSAGSPIFIISDAEGTQAFAAGQTRTFAVKAENVADFMISKPEGWRASYSNSVLSITAPVAANTFAETEGSVAISVVSANGSSLIVKVDVAIMSLRVLTFEDADARFSTYPLDYCDVNIAKWSDLIDSKQYGGKLLYGDGYGMEMPYYWYDEGNTELMHLFPEAYGSYCYWSGGHAISNYTGTNLAEGNYDKQLAVYGTGGHNGSRNFAVHNGYIDESGASMTSELCALEFYDGSEHVIDHMYVTNTLYAVASHNSEASLYSTDWALIEATGYDAEGNTTGTTTFYLFRGKDIVTDWTRWDLSSLGAVEKVTFNIKGTLANQWGLSTPAYFAYDDVAVRY